MPQLECKDLTLSYENHIVVRALSFSLGQGEAMCIVGENGAGKSTLVRALLGLKAPSGGQIIFSDGLCGRRAIGYLPQHMNVRRNFPASVQEIVMSGFLNESAFYKRRHYALARAYLEKLRIEGLRNKSFTELSSGQQQRVLLCRALCAAKKMLILDEPAANLDPVATAGFYELIGQINKDGVTVIMVSHDVPDAVALCDYVLHMGHDETFFMSKDRYADSSAGRMFMGEGRHV